jgi:TetR/AcrR family transcriptional regulator, transcriptional repressor for nem operon
VAVTKTATKTAQTQRERTGTADQILDVAERLVQVRGFNAFSYSDVAKEVHISTASLHYHFPTKSELGEALIARYAKRFLAALGDIDECAADAPRKLAAYVELYVGVLRNERMCLCGMLAAEHETLSAGMQGAVVDFFEENETWLAEVLQQGRDRGSLRFAGSPLEEGRSIVSALEGAMLVARSFGDITRFQAVAEHLLSSLHP